MYQEFRPDRRLLPFVECGWVRSHLADHSIHVLPDGCVDLFVASGGGEVLLAGPATTFYHIHPDDGCILTGLRLRPGAASAVIGKPVRDFTDNRVPIDSFFDFSGHRMAEKVLAQTSHRQRVATLESLLISHFANVEPVVDRTVTRAVEMLQRRPDLPISSLTATFDLSERQLRRRFEAAVGFSPKRFSRVIRFQRLLELIHVADGQVGWAELAATAKYADQSHMINECMALAGVSPTGLPDAAMVTPTTVSVSSNTASDRSS